MSPRGDADPVTRRRRRPVPRAALVALVLAAVVGDGTTPAVAAQGAGAQPVCTTFLSTATVAQIAGVGTKPYGVVTYRKKFRGIPIGPGNRFPVPGSVCQWIDDPEPQTPTLHSTANLTVGYGESAAGWKRLVAHFRDGAEDGPYSPLHLGQGSTAFVNTEDLAAAYGYTPGTPGLPTYLYKVTVLTRRHNILQVWFRNASLAATQSWVIGILQHRTGF